MCIQKCYKDSLISLGVGLITGISIFILLYPLFKLRALGAGDIKLLCIMGIALGVHLGFFCLAAAFVLGAMIGVLRIVWKKMCAEQWNRNTKIHFSIPIFLSYILHVGGIY